MNWHNQLETFASRGLKAQQAVDRVIEEHARRTELQPGDCVPVADVLAAIGQSRDAAWLRKVATDRENPYAVRIAAEKRWKALRRKKAL